MFTWVIVRWRRVEIFTEIISSESSLMNKRHLSTYFIVLGVLVLGFLGIMRNDLLFREGDEAKDFEPGNTVSDNSSLSGVEEREQTTTEESEPDIEEREPTTTGESEPDIGESDVNERTYAKSVINNETIILEGDDILEIIDTNYTMINNIVLNDNSKLIIKDSILLHVKDYAFQYGLQANDNSQVIVNNSKIGNVCTGSLNWSFGGNSSLTATDVEWIHCNIWIGFSDRSKATIENWDELGATIGDNSELTIGNSTGMEIELCFTPGNTTVETALPSSVTDFAFPDGDDSGITFKLYLHDSSVSWWGISVLPGNDITILDTPALTTSIIVGLPWRNQTVVLENLKLGHYGDQTWEIADATLRLVNVTTYGWEPNVFSDNVLIIRNSTYAGSSFNSGTAKYIIETSRFGLARTEESVEMTVIDSVIEGDVIATGNSTIILINTEVYGNIFEEDNGEVIIYEDD